MIPLEQPMPLRDHFHPPLSKRSRWDALHGAWPTLMVMDLNSRLPPRYIASPRIHLGSEFEIDVAASERNGSSAHADEGSMGEGTGGTSLWAPPQPTMIIETDLPDIDEYEVQI